MSKAEARKLYGEQGPSGYQRTYLDFHRSRYWASFLIEKGKGRREWEGSLFAAGCKLCNRTGGTKAIGRKIPTR